MPAPDIEKARYSRVAGLRFSELGGLEINTTAGAALHPQRSDPAPFGQPRSVVHSSMKGAL